MRLRIPSYSTDIENRSAGAIVSYRAQAQKKCKNEILNSNFYHKLEFYI